LEGATEWTPATYVTLRSWQVEHDLGGVPYTVWVDDLGQVVDATTPTGFHMERTAYEIAYENFENRRAAATTLVASPGAPIERRTALAAGVGPPDGNVDTLRVRVRNLRLDAFALDGGTQTRAGDTLLVVSGTPGPAYRLPFDGDSLVRRYLGAGPLLASDDTRVQAQARQAIGRTRNPERAAQELVTWVHERLVKDPDARIAGAVDVLEERRGDASEHAQLFVALARAVGLPARLAAGLALVDGRFYYHAWAEVYFDDWVPVDPTFGQFPADAARLRLTIGGQGHPLDLIRMIGQLDLEVVEARSE
jgi:transglutaminase-like putative cysteine protease